MQPVVTSPHESIVLPTWAFYPWCTVMRPSQVTDFLRSMANDIDLSGHPSAAAVAADIEIVIAAVESGQSRTAWSLFKSKGVKKTEAKIKGLKSLVKAMKKLIGEIRSGEDFADFSGNAEYVRALHGASQHIRGDSEVLKALSHVENEGDVRDLLTELDRLYDEDDDSELGDRKAMVSAVDAFAKQAEERIRTLQDRLKEQEAEAKKGRKMEGEEPKAPAPKEPSQSMFQKLRERAKGKSP